METKLRALTAYDDDLSSIEQFPSGKLFRILYDSQIRMLRIISKQRELFEELRNVFSVENKSAFFSQQYGYRGNSRLYNINAFGYFQPGLIYDISEWIKTQYGSLNVVAISQNCASFIHDMLMPLKKSIDTDDLKILNISDDRGINEKIRKQLEDNPNSSIHEFKFRQYQQAAIAALIQKGYGRGLIEIPTAGGKSFIIANFIWNIINKINSSAKTLILVPNVQLVEQFYKDLTEYGYDVSELAKFEGGMSKKEKIANDVNSAKIVIANRQYVFKNKAKLPKFDILICDEVHTVNSESTAQLIHECDAKIKIGCTGTLPSNKYYANQLIGMFGRVVYTENITDLQKDGFISKLKITSINIIDQNVQNDRSLLFNINSIRKYRPDDPDCDIRFDDSVKAEHEYTAKWYEQLYSPVLNYASKLDGNVLVLFDKLDIGKNIYELFVREYPSRPCFYNDGRTDVGERERTRNGLEQSGNNVLFANVQILSTGVNIRRLHHIVFCFGSKSTVRIIQSIGRALRLYADKEYAHLVDTHFNFKYSDRHFRERLSMYKDFYNKIKPDESLTFYV